MKRTIKISRPASGAGTVVTVTLLEDGVTATYAYRSASTKIGESIKFADAGARDMLRQAREHIDQVT